MDQRAASDAVHRKAEGRPHTGHVRAFDNAATQLSSSARPSGITGQPLEVISFGLVGRLSVMVGIVERLVPDELWELF
ncbi:hypothetical protein, partial [Streptomyces sp. NPDC002738]